MAKISQGRKALDEVDRLRKKVARLEAEVRRLKAGAKNEK
jgi:hypothetical protein